MPTNHAWGEKNLGVTTSFPPTVNSYHYATTPHDDNGGFG